MGRLLNAQLLFHRSLQSDPPHGPPTVKEVRKVTQVAAAALSELGFTTSALDNQQARFAIVGVAHQVVGDVAHSRFLN